MKGMWLQTSACGVQELISGKVKDIRKQYDSPVMLGYPVSIPVACLSMSIDFQFLGAVENIIAW